jgi:hypothetical protein
MAGPALVQANHHLAERFLRNNRELYEADEGEEEPFFDDSGRRLGALVAALAGLPPSCPLDEVARTLEAAPVLNRYTCQRMLFCPAAGVVRVWGAAAV